MMMLIAMPRGVPERRSANASTCRCSVDSHWHRLVQTLKGE